MQDKKAQIGVFGGSGFYRMDGAEEIKIDTPYGAPSDKITLTEIGGKKVAFIPRHGKEHQIPAHMINYRANLWALKELGVTRVIGPCAAGSLQADVKPGDFVICDQFVDRTRNRKDTFYDGPITTHISAADPYCPEMRALAIEKARKLSIPVHETGTVVVIQGPRFSTRAESRWFGGQGWEVINMTQYPESILARELGMCYVNISLITDYDVGLDGNPDIMPVTHERVIEVFKNNNDKLRGLLCELIGALPDQPGCSCYQHLLDARMV
ncbi:MAG: S-methyl-5'-thioadenosine phosphorylase [Firmicutes bacterium]|nr:S-methyl-5'-thioadenosine phosphorylase [Bacillota bacterium]